MKVFTDVLTECMEIYDHSIEQLADVLNVTVADANKFIDGVDVPKYDTVKLLIDTYHLDADNVIKVWQRSRKDLIELIRSRERQFNAITALPLIAVDTATDLNRRRMVILCASQYFHNTLLNADKSTDENIQFIMDVRNELVYNIGSQKMKDYDAKLLDNEVWDKLYNYIEKAIS